MYCVKLHKSTNLKMCLRLTEMYYKVLHPQHIQYHTARIQRHHHHKKHSEVKKQSILRYSFIITFWWLRHNYILFVFRNAWYLRSSSLLCIKFNIMSSVEIELLPPEISLLTISIKSSKGLKTSLPPEFGVHEQR